MEARVAAVWLHPRTEKDVECLNPVAGDDNLVRNIALLKGQDRKLLVVAVILDEQYYLPVRHALLPVWGRV